MEVFGMTINPSVTKFTVSWSPPLESNGVIILYELCFNSSELFSCINKSDTQHTLPNVPPNTVVIFSVRA